MSLNPEIAAYLELVEAGRSDGRTLPMHALEPDQAREAFDQSSLLMSTGGDDLGYVEALSIPTRDGHALPARLYAAQRPDGAPAVLYLHGGGYVVGSLESHDALCRTLAARSGCAVLAVDYRLAPQWRFPTAVHDAEDAWRWLGDNADRLGLNPDRLAIAGDSVGGSLATVVSVMGDTALRPRVQVLIYPVTDATASAGSMARYASGHLLEARTLQWFYDHYATAADDRLDPRFSPVFADIPADAPPALLVLAECDPLLDEGLAYGRRLEQAGVPVEVRVFAGMTHDFLRMDALIDEAGEAIALIAGVLRERLSNAGRAV